MVRIPQHREDAGLNDLSRFIRDLECYQSRIDYWIIDIEECVGTASTVLAELTLNKPRISHLAFQDLCNSISQTIDGSFEGVINNQTVIKLEAVDSTFWEITASEEFERLMANQYGEYKN